MTGEQWKPKVLRPEDRAREEVFNEAKSRERYNMSMDQLSKMEKKEKSTLKYQNNPHPVG